jgi:hypothetical protein
MDTYTKREGRVSFWYKYSEVSDLLTTLSLIIKITFVLAIKMGVVKENCNLDVIIDCKVFLPDYKHEQKNMLSIFCLTNGYPDALPGKCKVNSDMQVTRAHANKGSCYVFVCYLIDALLN